MGNECISLLVGSILSSLDLFFFLFILNYIYCCSLTNKCDKFLCFVLRFYFLWTFVIEILLKLCFCESNQQSVISYRIVSKLDRRLLGVNKIQEFFTSFWIISEHTQHSRCYSFAVDLLNTTHYHAHVTTRVQRNEKKRKERKWEMKWTYRHC